MNFFLCIIDTYYLFQKANSYNYYIFSFIDLSQWLPSLLPLFKKIQFQFLSLLYKKDTTSRQNIMTQNSIMKWGLRV